MTLPDPSAGAFGRRGLDRAPPPIPQAMTPARATGRVALLAFVLALLAMSVAGFVWTLRDLTAINAKTAEATRHVVEIVNQPVTHLPRTDEAAVFSPGWFHPGALRPGFDRVDVRTSQEFPYAGDTYVTSDIDPSEMFLGDELEFNAMTKYFYTDRTVPKKKLTEPEMLEINRLYRVIGHDDAALPIRWLELAGLVLVAGLLGRAEVALLGPVVRRGVQ